MLLTLVEKYIKTCPYGLLPKTLLPYFQPYNKVIRLRVDN